MFDLAYSTICGRLATDVTTKTTVDGKEMASFSVAVNIGKDKTNFYSISSFGFLASYATEQLAKGSRVTVLGRAEQVISKEGKPYMRINADYIFPGAYKAITSQEELLSEGVDDFV